MLTRFFTLILIFVALTSQAAPKAELIPYWNKSAKEFNVSVDHSTWQGFLDTYLVTKSGEATRVAYGKVTRSDKQKLDAYITKLTGLDPLALTKRQQFAYWVNLYNAVTVQLILNNYPVDSIKDTGKGFFSFGPWNDELMTINNKAISLNDVEHGILRPIWKDPRIHYVVNCASIGCPNLSALAVTKDNYEALMDNAARNFVNSARGVSFDEGTLIISSIYDWFAEDFGDSKKGLFKHLTIYAEPILADKLSSYDGRVRYEYDWSLNDSSESNKK